MDASPTTDHFLRDPLGHWVRIGPSVVWCADASRVGVALWGEPSREDLAAVLGIFERWDPSAPPFDILADLTAGTNLAADAFDLLVEWTRKRKSEILRRIRTRVIVLPAGIAGFALAGIGPVVDGLDRTHVGFDLREGFRLLYPDEFTAHELHDEVAAIVRSTAGNPLLLANLRAVLDASPATMSLASATRALSLSARSLQRELATHGTSFRAEVADARFRAATEWLRTSDLKVAAIASRIGISDVALARIIRSRTRLTPSQYRVQLRSR